MEIVSAAIEDYLEQHLHARPKVVREMEGLAEREDFPVVGPQVGMLLELLARAIQAKSIIDLGSGWGYSGLWLARGLGPGGKIILTDHSEENMKMAKASFTRMGLRKSMLFKLGNAVEVFREETGPFDIVFNDVDKKDYPEVIDMAFDRLRKGGLLIADNTLWYGAVTEPDPDENTRSILEFNRRLSEHEGFHTVQIPLRDGISISLKK